MSGPPPAPALPQPISVPPPAYPPYGVPYSPYNPYYSPPPKRDNLVLIIVVIVVVILLGSMVMAAILYVMVSGLIGGPQSRPILVFGPADQTGGNASFTIGSSSGSIRPDSLRVRLQANASAGGPFGLPPPNGSVLITAGRYLLRVFWLDTDRSGLVGTGDMFRITGNLAPLPPSTIFLFSLTSPDGSMLEEVSWATP